MPPETTEQQTDSADKARGTTTRDPEAVAIVKVMGSIDGLEDDAKGRVVRYLAERYARFLQEA